MKRVLIIDDNEADRVLAAELLSRVGFVTECAKSGEQGIEIVRAGNADLVITDLVMPGMDGMRVLERIREEFSRIPVVVITSAGSELTAVDALKGGAASYVPKAHLMQRLTPTVQQIVELARADRSYLMLLERLDISTYRFVLESDLSLIGPTVEFIQQITYGLGVCEEPDLRRVGVAVEEAILNAMYHGNLELDGNRVAEVLCDLREGTIPEFVLERCRHPDCADRQVQIDVRITRGELTVTIEDDGHGFEHSKLPDSCDVDTSRGLVLISTIMDDVIFNERGNRMTLVKKRHNSNGQRSARTRETV